MKVVFLPTYKLKLCRNVIIVGRKRNSYYCPPQARPRPARSPAPPQLSHPRFLTFPPPPLNHARMILKCGAVGQKYAKPPLEQGAARYTEILTIMICYALCHPCYGFYDLFCYVRVVSFGLLRKPNCTDSLWICRPAHGAFLGVYLSKVT